MNIIVTAFTVRKTFINMWSVIVASAKMRAKFKHHKKSRKVDNEVRLRSDSIGKKVKMAKKCQNLCQATD